MTLHDYYSLLPLIILTGISLGVRSMAPFAWGKGLMFQCLLILMAVAYGIILRNIYLAQIAGWFLFLLFHVPAWYVFGQVKRSMSRMNTDEMARWGQNFAICILGSSGPVLERYGQWLYCFFE